MFEKIGFEKQKYVRDDIGRLYNIRNIIYGVSNLFTFGKKGFAIPLKSAIGVITNLAAYTIRCHEEIDRLKNKIPTENLKTPVGDEFYWFSELPRGVYRLFIENKEKNKDNGEIVCMFDGNYMKDWKGMIKPYVIDLKNITHYQLLYELPKDKREFTVKGNLITSLTERTMASSQEEANALIAEKYNSDIVRFNSQDCNEE